jgi:hypothetical protein
MFIVIVFNVQLVMTLAVSPLRILNDNYQS